MSRPSFFKLGIIYTLGQVMLKAVSFILLPIYTRQLGAAVYGQLALVDTVLGFVSAFAIVGVYSGYIRFYRDYDEDDRKVLKGTAVIFAFGMALIDLVLVLSVGSCVAPYILRIANADLILVLVVLRSIFTGMISLFMADYTLNYQATKFVFISVFQLLLNLGFVIFYVVFKKMAILGIYKGYVLSNIPVLLFLLYSARKSFRLEFDLSMLKNMLKFSAGLIPSSLSSLILTMADRYFLVGYRGFVDTGIYSVGYKFGTLINPLFVQPFASIFTPYKFQIWKDDDCEDKFNSFFVKYHVIGCFIMLAISVNSKLIISVFTTKEYISAYKLVPLILLSYFMFGKGHFYNLGIQLHNKTYLSSCITIVGAVVNVMFNVFLIPKYGMMGAATATVLSYQIINILRLKISAPLFNVIYDFKKMFFIYCITCLLYGVYFMISLFNLGFIVEFFAGLLILISYGLVLFFSGIVNRDSLKRYYVKICKIESNRGRIL